MEHCSTGIEQRSASCTFEYMIAYFTGLLYQSIEELRNGRDSSLTSDDSLECSHGHDERNVRFPIACFVGFTVCERCGVDGQLDRSASIAAANVSYQHGSAFFGLLRFGFLGFTHVQHIPSLGEVRRTVSLMIIKQSKRWNLNKKRPPTRPEPDEGRLH